MKGVHVRITEISLSCPKAVLTLSETTVDGFGKDKCSRLVTLRVLLNRSKEVAFRIWLQ